ncbi:hypothetical protein BH23CHL4_BH23CHL4_05700 [soil metagenome]
MESMTRRGFGVAAAIPVGLIGPLAKAAEDAGYSTFWVNDTPGADGIQALGHAAAATSSIRLGTGVIPLDRRSPEAIAASVNDASLPVERLVIGIGAGGVHLGSLDMVERGIGGIQQLTGGEVAIGALGMKMVGLAGRLADGVILNWMTAEWALRSAEIARGSDRLEPVEIIGYVRTALQESRAKLEAEANRYSSFPAYARHFHRMGVPAIETCVIGSSQAIAVSLQAFDAVLEETVVRAIVSEESLDSYLAVLNAGLPG